MANILDSSKSQLGKLLASENIRIEHRAVQGPYFDVQARVLVLPIWKDMDADLYDLMIGHEVGHALYTPAEGWMEKVDELGLEYKTFLNLVEDARIEKKMKRMYPGLKRPMYNGYTQLVDRGFFGVSFSEMKLLPFADRANVYFKLGVRSGVSFNEKEQDLVDRIEDVETFEDVLSLAKEFYDVAKNEKNDLDEMFDDIMDSLDDDSMDDDGDGGGAGAGASKGEDDMLEDSSDTRKSFTEKLRKQGKNVMADALEQATDSTKQRLKEWMENDDVASITQDAFKENEVKLLDETAFPISYIQFPDLRIEDWVTPHEITHSPRLMKFSTEMERQRNTIYANFMNANKRYINYMVKEFELRRNAKQLAKAKVSKTGKLDTDKLWSYKISENLFLQRTTVPNGKNHGMLMVIDMSSSMQHSMTGTLEQLVSLVMFCRKVNIPFDVYGFIDNNSSELELMARGIHHSHTDLCDSRNDTHINSLQITTSTFRLKQLFHSNMRLAAFNNALQNVLMIAEAYRGPYNYYGYRDNKVPESMHLSGTPLNETILVLRHIAEKFKKETHVDILNTIILTDGDASYSLGLKDENGKFSRLYGNVTYILEDKKREHQVKMSRSGYNMTPDLLEMYKKITNSRVLGIFLISDRNVKSTIHRKASGLKDFDEMQFTQQYAEQYTRHKYFALKTPGYDVYYMVPGETLEIGDMDMGKMLKNKENTKKDLLKAFKKMQTTKQVSRVFLNQFIKNVA